MTTIKRIQTVDINGNVITSASHGDLIVSNTTTPIFTGAGVLLGVGIWKDVDGGTVHFTDQDDDPIDGLPNATNKGVTDFAGTFPVARLELSNGLKVVTANAAGVVMSIYTLQPSD